MPAKSPEPIEPVSLKLYVADWEWLQAHRPREASALVRAIVRAYVARERARSAN